MIQHGLDLRSHRLAEVILDMTNGPAKVSSNHQAGILQISQVLGQHFLGRMPQFATKLSKPDRSGTNGAKYVYLPFALHKANGISTRTAVILWSVAHVGPSAYDPIC